MAYRTLPTVAPASTATELASLLAAELQMQHKIGPILLEQGLIDRLELDLATLAQNRTPERKLGEILVSQGVLTHEQVQRVVLGVVALPPQVTLAHFDIAPVILNTISPQLATRYQVVPLLMWQDQLVLATAAPLDEAAIQALRFYCEHPIRIALAPAQDIATAIIRHYELPQLEVELQSMSDQVTLEQVNNLDWEDAEEQAQQQPIVQMVNSIVVDAVMRNASDIHLRPAEHETHLEFRIDGVMQAIRTIPRNLHNVVVSRIKIVGGMNISEHRKPQDGRIHFRYRDAELDLRVSIIPADFGESVVIRLLYRNAGLRQVSQIGFAGPDEARFRELIGRSYGIVLVTGPTGSGKSTTLYAALQEMATGEVSIVTVEDPIEIELDAMLQIQLNRAAGFDFPQALRSILRHDPDIIMIGEIRDTETCKIAMESALTGHMVLSTLHTNDAPSSIVRLIEMGVEPYLIKSAVIGVVSQRLLRRNCPHCLTIETVEPLIRQGLGVLPSEAFYRGKGCEQCHGGFLGRTAAYELMVMDDGIRAQIAPQTQVDLVRQAAVRNGMTTLVESALGQARNRLVALSEVYRTCT